MDDPIPDAAAAGHGAFADMFRREFSRLSGYCAGLVDDVEVGRDIAQEALTRTWARWPILTNPRAYAYLVATNLCRRHWKARARERTSRVTAIGEARNLPASDGTVRDLVERLPERLRRTALLHYYADLSVEEVAKVLRRPKGTVTQRLHEARRLLAADLKEE